MNYDRAFKQFNICNHLKDLEGLDRIEMINETNRVCNQAEKISIPRNTENRSGIEYLRQKYISALSGLSFFLQWEKKPYGVDEDTFRSFKPIIESLVKKGQLKEVILSKFTSSSKE